jgi:hypothetical protein
LEYKWSVLTFVVSEETQLHSYAQDGSNWARFTLLPEIIMILIPSRSNHMPWDKLYYKLLKSISNSDIHSSNISTISS